MRNSISNSETLLFLEIFCIWILLPPKGVNPCNQPLFETLCNCRQNRALAGFVIHSFTTTIKAQCSRACVQHENCTSFNVGEPSAGIFSCELNANDVTPTCSDLTERQNFEFFFWVGKTFTPITCKRLKDQNSGAISGVYGIKPTESVEPFNVSCDMDTAGGGWTLVYSYRLVDLSGGPARVSVWPTWDMDSDVPKSTAVPLSDLEEGAMDFELWKSIGEEFLITSTVTNWYHCAPSTSNGTPGSLVQWTAGDFNCSVVKAEIPGTGCDDAAPADLGFAATGPYFGNGGNPNIFIFYDGSSSTNYPTHDPCGTNTFGSEASRSTDPRGAIYVR